MSESDSAYRTRIIDQYGMWGAFCTVVLESSGAALDVAGESIGVKRDLGFDFSDDEPTEPFLKALAKHHGESCPDCGSAHVEPFKLEAPGYHMHCGTCAVRGCGKVWAVKC